MSSSTEGGLIDLELVYHWCDLSKKPKVIVFDLDHTLWKFYIEYESAIPFRKLNDTKVLNANQTPLECPSDVPSILYTLKNNCFAANEKLAIASRSQRTDLAHHALQTFGWKHYFDSIQVYSCPKNVHMYAIRDELKVSSNFNDFLFFDDNKFNIQVATDMGICAILVDKRRGLDLNYMHYGLDLFEKSS